MNLVSLRKCNDYEYDNIKKSIEMMLDDLGGIEKFVSKNSKVLIKPNLLMKKRPEEATTTHPMVVKVLCEKLLKLNCEVIIGDSPGGPYTVSSLKGIYKSSGMKDVADELGITLNYDISDVKVENYDANALKYMDIITPITKVDHIINICKFKTHGMATFTGGVKNLYGCIAGLKKAEIHYRFPTEELFCEEVLLDICSYVNPTLTIMDGVVGMEGDGPSAGVPRHLGVMLASQSPYALDAVACKIINLNSDRVPTLRGSIKRGYIKEDFSDINILGEDIEKLIIKDFKIPSTSKDFRLLKSSLPKFLHEPITKLITPKPVVRHKDCIKCGKCIQACPAKVMSFNENKVTINLDNCIRCYCCHELCPKKAVDIKRNFIFKLIK
ncbi:DUF362 domain-containing protein [Romboutsia lituseburensis]|uniref:Ferredoxin n=2 Tax=root TaxID=1 RepID=A0A1G9KF97_9FIRM|nr:DUF362 domain-containing protein [Romboutsia lituseburensis]CEH34884.1 4Fe-4S binding domain protein [Romboutsia lituseburensis]SDL48319.1 Uncharacterized conserved protein, DUF362 family [Romboutsia lituseburensis DSM 797]